MKKGYIYAVSAGCLAVIALSGCGCKRNAEEISTEEKTPGNVVVPYEKPANASPITGLACDNYDKRPFGVMYSGDVETRPYFSNITKADMVVEMPHRAIHDGTRVMGVFGCNAPTQIGPMRSARVDFMNVAGSIDAVFVLWGGDSVTKNLLDNKVMNSLTCADGGVNAGDAACYRLDKGVVPLDMEDRAFTSMPELIKSASGYGYSNQNTFAGFEHQGEISRDQRPEYGQISVGYDNPFRVNYEYNPETNSYDRLFNKKEEYDFVTKERVSPKNVIVIQTKKDAFYIDTDYVSQGLRDPWAGIDETHKKNDNGQYPNFQLGDPWFDTRFEGEAYFYMNGQEIVGTWKKERGDKKPFKFYDANGQDVHFVPGQIWLQVVSNGKTVKWNPGTAEDRAENKTKREQAALAPATTATDATATTETTAE
ncbi:MAG: DUF3048 domain-containing protein [Parcubacteria group bacterium]|jgi:hypothetical protein